MRADLKQNEENVLRDHVADWHQDYMINETNPLPEKPLNDAINEWISDVYGGEN